MSIFIGIDTQSIDKSVNEIIILAVRDLQVKKMFTSKLLEGTVEQ